MKKQIGVVGVDSGQILVCDPCYIDSQWKDEDFGVLRRYRHNDGTILQYGRDFGNYEEPILKYGKTMNQILSDKEAIDMPDDVPAENPFSYNACCKKTCGDDKDGQLNYELGHPGVGVVTSSGYGDGEYPVIADIDDKTGRVKSITVIFIEEDEILQEDEEREAGWDKNYPKEDHGERDERIRKSFE